MAYVCMCISGYELLHKILNNVLYVLLGLITELDSVTSHSEIVPDTVIFDDFQRSITFCLIFVMFICLIILSIN